MAAGFEKTWQRLPTSQELASLVHDRVREEVFLREATALGLDKDDTVIPRRLRQKMEFASQDDLHRPGALNPFEIQPSHRKPFQEGANVQ